MQGVSMSAASSKTIFDAEQCYSHCIFANLLERWYSSWQNFLSEKNFSLDLALEMFGK